MISSIFIQACPEARCIKNDAEHFQHGVILFQMLFAHHSPALNLNDICFRFANPKNSPLHKLKEL